MSKNYVKTVLDELPALTSSTDALVLVAIAEHTSDETRLAWPSIAALVRRTRLSRRGVQKIVRRLEARRLVSITTGGHFDGDNRANCYRLEFDHRGHALTSTEPAKRPARRINSPVPAPLARSHPKAVPNPPSARQLVDGLTLARGMLTAGGAIPYSDADIIRHAHITPEQLAELRRSST